jgi:hypothetical protein
MLYMPSLECNQKQHCTHSLPVVAPEAALHDSHMRCAMTRRRPSISLRKKDLQNGDPCTLCGQHSDCGL